MHLSKTKVPWICTFYLYFYSVPFHHCRLNPENKSVRAKHKMNLGFLYIVNIELFLFCFRGHSFLVLASLWSLSHLVPSFFYAQTSLFSPFWISLDFLPTPPFCVWFSSGFVRLVDVFGLEKKNPQSSVRPGINDWRTLLKFIDLSPG